MLSIRDLPKPELESGRVLVKIHAVSLNPLDWRLMRADPFLIRLFFGLFKHVFRTVYVDALIITVASPLVISYKQLQCNEERFSTD